MINENVKRNRSLCNLNYSDLKENPPNVAILPWGATEAHNQHLPYATDVVEAQLVSEHSASLASEEGAKVVVLPPIPFGNNAQHLDQYTTVHLRTESAMAILRDVVASLVKQGIDRLIVANSHGGNQFKPLIRDLQNEFPVLIILVDIYAIIPDEVSKIFDEPGDHAGELETSLMMYLFNSDADLSEAGNGIRIPFEIPDISGPGIWTPRPWSVSHPDLGSGNPAKASYEKGEKYFISLCKEFKKTIFSLSTAVKGNSPYHT